jgi:hypothetical protein
MRAHGKGCPERYSSGRLADEKTLGKTLLLENEV